MNRPGIRWDRRLEAAVVLVAGIAFGAWREFAFINLNYQIDHVQRHTPFSYAHSMVQRWIGGWDLTALVTLKWTLAFLSMAIIAGLCILLARILYGHWRHARWVLAGFAGFAGLSLAMHLLARWVPALELVAVGLSHMLQYPVPLVFILVGTTVWISFVNLINAPLQGFNNGKAIYTKLNVPPEAFVMSAVLRAILNFLIRIGILIPVFVYFKFTPPWTAFLFPVAVMSFFLIALAIGLWAIPFGSLFSDVGNFLTNFVRIFMYLSPVIYPIGRKTGWFKAIMVYNPLTPGVAWSRDTITTGSYEWAVPCLVYGGISVILIFLALIFLRISRPHLVARLGM